MLAINGLPWTSEEMAKELQGWGMEGVHAGEIPGRQGLGSTCSGTARLHLPNDVGMCFPNASVTAEVKKL